MRRGAYLFAFIACVLLLAIIAITSVEVVAMDRSFYLSEYRKLDRAQYIDISEDGLMEVTDNLLNYMSGSRENLDMRQDIQGKEREVFNQREKEHMVDVRALYGGVIFIRNAAVAVLAALLLCVILMARRDAARVLARAYLGALVAAVIVMSSLAVWVAIDFSGFWIYFHEVFFTNDLWILNPNTDIMINMFPQQFFFDCVSRIGVICAVSVAVLAVASSVVIIIGRHRRNMPVRGGRA
ncbi:MAG: TIGR01906 family membrane protein [Christensenellales bacterium]|jgi:integral membrane protein (TIGR01906 family)